MAEALDSDTILLRQAAEWVDRVRKGADAQTRAAFASWRGASPAHAEAVREVERAWHAARAANDAPELLSLRQETLARVIARTSRARPIPIFVKAAAAILLLLAGALAVPLLKPVRPTGATLAQADPNPVRYATAIGERRTVRLPDGSMMTLNTASRARIAYSNAERAIVLESGEAQFQVAHGQARPFRVIAGDRRITAHGTVFDVRLLRGNVQVLLVEGVVSVEGIGGHNRGDTVTMSPNELLVAAPEAVSVRRVERLADYTGWRDGLILFDDRTLESAVGEINRYIPAPIEIGDPRLAQLHISGAFETGNSQAFLEAVEMYFPIKVERRPDGRAILTRRDRG